MRECADYSRPDHRSAVRRFLRLYPDLEQIFDGTWIAAALQPLKPRSDLPPIFWALANPARHGRLTQALTLISEQRSIRPIVKELESTDERNVSALLAELEVFRMIRLRNDSAKWKPPAPTRGGRSPDLSLMWNGQTVLLEIFAIGQADEERNERLALDMVHRFISRMENHRYFISFEVKSRFSFGHVRDCCLFVKATVNDLVARRIGSAQVHYRVAGQAVLAIEFERQVDRKGGWVSTMHDVHESTQSARIKKKMLDKLDVFQFPPSTESIHGYVIVVDEMFNDQETVNAAIVGRTGVRVQWSGTTPQIVWFRQPDGTIHDPTRADRLVERVDFILSMKQRGSMFLDPLGLIMNDDLKRITREQAWALLWDNPPNSR